jgi:hypothetical protein
MKKQLQSLESLLSHFNINFQAESRASPSYRAPLLWAKLTGFCAVFYGLVNKLDFTENQDNYLIVGGILVYGASSLASFYLSRRNHKK